MSNATPLATVSRGVAAGAIGTAAMDVLWFYRYKRDGGTATFLDWEFSRGLSSWEDAGPPAQVGKRLFEGVLQRELRPERAGLVNDLMHWAYGLFWGAQYGIVAASLRTRRSLRHGIAFGSFVWTSDYIVLPLAKVYRPMWEYDVKTLADDLSAHLLYGVAAATTFRFLCRPSVGNSFL